MPTSVGERFKVSAHIPVSVAASLLLGPSTLFFVFTCPWLTENVSLALPASAGITFLFVMANFTMATFMDAGVLPRANDDEDKEDDLRAPLYKNVNVQGVQVRLKWCTSCRFYRPPRCSHCSVCDQCVEDFDHHCPWVNNCIGRRNYRCFLLFLLSLSIHILVVFSGGLLFVLDHPRDLWELRSTVTLAVMSVSGLFFIPIMGLACFHLVLVARGRTTNEQVTGKFHGGVNPFTRGCCGNMEFVLCRPITSSYNDKPGKGTSVRIQPPFQTPESIKRPPVNAGDNGIQNNTLPTKETQPARTLEVPECKRLNTPPPLPPKPDPALLKRRLASLERHILQSNTAMLTAQDIKKSSPLESPSRVHYQVPREQIGKREESLPLNSLTLNTHSLSLKQAHRQGDRAHLLSQRPEALPSHSAQSLLSPGAMRGHSSSLSYDSLLGSAALAQHRVIQLGYLHRFLPLEPGQDSICPTNPHPAAPSTCSPVQSYVCRGTSAVVHHDSLSAPVMSSIQERGELEDREKQLLVLQVHSLPSSQKAGVYNMPGRHSLPLDLHDLPSRGPTPPAYGSRDFLVSSAVYGHGSRMQLTCSSTSSLSQAHRTSGSPTCSGLAHQGHSLSPSACHLREYQGQHSPSAFPGLPPTSFYTAQKAPRSIVTSEKKHSVNSGS